MKIKIKTEKKLYVGIGFYYGNVTVDFCHSATLKDASEALDTGQQSFIVLTKDEAQMVADSLADILQKEKERKTPCEFCVG